MPIDHVKLPVGDLDASRAFYSAALAPFGYRLAYDEEPSLGFGLGDVEAARRELAEIEKRCGRGCEEYQDLAEAIEKADGKT